jgi:hypothetical protein
MSANGENGMKPIDERFAKVLELFEKNGYKLQKIQGRYRVFTKSGADLWQIPVENGKVKSEYVEKIIQFFKEEQGPCRIPD